MDYTVVEVGGAQFKVKKGDTIKADFSLGQSKKTAKITKVVMHHSGKKLEIGNPYIKDASVSFDVLEEGKAKKVTAYKYRRRKSSKFKKGHRQRSITLKVKEIDIA